MNTSPDFTYWRTLAKLRVWQVAAMMRGVEPRAMSEVVDRNGDGLDLAPEIAALTMAIDVHQIQAWGSDGTAPNDRTEVLAASVITWLRTHGHPKLATSLESGCAGGAASNKRWTPEFTEEVREFRKRNTAAATAKRFGVSTARIREMLAKDKAVPRGASVFHRA